MEKILLWLGVAFVFVGVLTLPAIPTLANAGNPYEGPVSSAENFFIEKIPPLVPQEKIPELEKLRQEDPVELLIEKARKAQDSKKGDGYE